MHKAGNKLNNRPYTPWALALLLAAGACGTPNPAVDDTPTSGSVLMIADADCRTAIDKELMVFSAFYPKAHIRMRYMDEGALLQAMLNDSVRCVVTATVPTGAQQAFYQKRNITTPVVPVYKSGIAVVVNKESTLQHLDLQGLARLLGKGMAAGTDTLQAFFVGQGSGIARLLKDTLHLQTLRAQAMQDVGELVAQVSRSTRSVGFLPFEALSDQDDPQVQALRSQVRLLPIARTATDPPVAISQSTLADGSYPLPRTVNILLTEGKSGLGTGFVSFVANHKGQRIILKLGLVPIKIPERNIEIVHE